MIRNGGRDLEEAIYCLMKRERNEWYLKAMLLKMGLTREECEEALDDTYMALVKAVREGKFDEKRSIGAYLWGAARNTGLKEIRRRPKTPLADNPGHSSDPPAEDPRLAKLLQLFDMLTEKCRNILRLAFLEEKSNEEITELLGYKSKSVFAVQKNKCINGLRKKADEAGLF